ncbi:hypothetical protein, partial [Pseudomonas asplenii]|uniref:hypothetical protein n=1 Tax=Pseudomonas asplenii TaxID=53407 RepID=UPI001E4118EE
TKTSTVRKAPIFKTNCTIAKFLEIAVFIKIETPQTTNKNTPQASNRLKQKIPPPTNKTKLINKIPARTGLD